jgi:hypothetical protein
VQSVHSEVASHFSTSGFFWSIMFLKARWFANSQTIRKVSWSMVISAALVTSLSAMLTSYVVSTMFCPMVLIVIRNVKPMKFYLVSVFLLVLPVIFLNLLSILYLLLRLQLIYLLLMWVNSSLNCSLNQPYNSAKLASCHFQLAMLYIYISCILLKPHLTPFVTIISHSVAVHS